MLFFPSHRPQVAVGSLTHHTQWRHPPTHMTHSRHDFNLLKWWKTNGPKDREAAEEEPSWNLCKFKRCQMEQKEKQEEWVLLYQIPGGWGRKKSLQLLDKDTLMFILRITTLQIRTHDFLASKWPRDCCCLVEKNTQDRQEVRKRNVHDMVAETNVHYYSARKVIEYCSYARTCSSPHFGWKDIHYIINSIKPGDSDSWCGEDGYTVFTTRRNNFTHFKQFQIICHVTCTEYRNSMGSKWFLFTVVKTPGADIYAWNTWQLKKICNAESFWCCAVKTGNIDIFTKWVLTVKNLSFH